MKLLIVLTFFMLTVAGYAQTTENIIVVTTDGFRWQEVFRGMDSSIANDKKFNEGDSNYIFNKYWANTEAERRQKLLPFLWSVVERNGQLYGNRSLGNKIDNANPYWFSYPGYSEMLTGYVDTAINSNNYPPNPNVTVLEFLNQQPNIKGKVAAFGAWEAFNRIINEKRSSIPIIAGFDTVAGRYSTPQQQLFNQMLANSYKPWHEEECLDVFTHYAAMEALKTTQPKVLYIAYGETDEWAHSGHYRSYLDAAHQVDAWLADIWNFVQSHPKYKNKTTLLISTDHGRGDAIKREWTSHGNSIQGASEIWLAVVGPGIKPVGEVKASMQLYQKQLAQTIAQLIGFRFTANHPVAEGITTLLK